MANINFCSENLQAFPPPFFFSLDLPVDVLLLLNAQTYFLSYSTCGKSFHNRESCVIPPALMKNVQTLQIIV